jgi:hypothetical protein
MPPPVLPASATLSGTLTSSSTMSTPYQNPSTTLFADPAPHTLVNTFIVGLVPGTTNSAHVTVELLCEPLVVTCAHHQPRAPLMLSSAFWSADAVALSMSSGEVPPAPTPTPRNTSHCRKGHIHIPSAQTQLAVAAEALAHSLTCTCSCPGNHGRRFDLSIQPYRENLRAQQMWRSKMQAMIQRGRSRSTLIASLAPASEADEDVEIGMEPQVEEDRRRRNEQVLSSPLTGSTT